MIAKRTIPGWTAVWAAAVLAAPSAGGTAAAEMVVETFSVGPGGQHPGTVRVAAAGASGTVIRVDLRALPKGRRVYRARLRVRRGEVAPTGAEALAGSEVYPLAAPFQAGKPPAPAAKPLSVPGPWYDCLDARSVVSASAGGWCELLVKSLPGWDGRTASLEVAYEGSAVVIPPQVSGLKVFHRAGQTFITWREIDPLVTDEKVTWGRIKQALAAAQDACRYRIYAHSRPEAHVQSATRGWRALPMASYTGPLPLP